MERSILESLSIRETSSKSNRKLALDEFLKEMALMGDHIRAVRAWLPHPDLPEGFRSQYGAIVHRTRRDLGELRARALKNIKDFVDSKDLLEEDPTSEQFSS